MALNRYFALVTSALVFAFACGGRTGANLGEYDVSDGSGGSGANNSRGGSTSTRGGSTGASGGTTSTRGGATSTGGTAGTTSLNDVVEQCVAYCEALNKRCPRRTPDASECMGDCKTLSIIDSACMPVISEALDCMSDALSLVTRCVGVQSQVERACAAVLNDVSSCIESEIPGSGGTGGAAPLCSPTMSSGSEDFCSTVASCNDGSRFDVGCKRTGDALFACSCTMQSGQMTSGGSFEMRSDEPDCNTALTRCGATLR